MSAFVCMFSLCFPMFGCVCGYLRVFVCLRLFACDCVFACVFVIPSV